jgi:hypothetical protein
MELKVMNSQADTGGDVPSNAEFTGTSSTAEIIERRFAENMRMVESGAMKGGVPARYACRGCGKQMVLHALRKHFANENVKCTSDMGYDVVGGTKQQAANAAVKEQTKTLEAMKSSMQEHFGKAPRVGGSVIRPTAQFLIHVPDTLFTLALSNAAKPVLDEYLALEDRNERLVEAKRERRKHGA